jgi:sterol desaturase/sphingolipid hydroxylase (fatty acid hydroxylase superfamily)
MVTPEAAVNVLLVAGFWSAPLWFPACLCADAVAITVIWGVQLVSVGYYEAISRIPHFDRYLIQKREFRRDEERMHREALHQFLLERCLNMALYVLLLRPRMDLEWTCSSPPLLEVWRDLALAMLWGEFYFYAVHRLLHAYLYAWHKRHHELTKPFALAIVRGELLETVTIIVPLFVGPMVVLRMPLLTILLWGTLMVCLSLYEHSGYDLPVRFCFVPFIGSPRMHDDHHRLNNCNFGLAYSFMDRLFGTHLPNLDIAPSSK